MFSIIIPTYNNLKYFKICINSIYKNSLHDHELIIHINDGSDGTKKYVEENKLKYTYTKNNVGLCSGINLAASLSTTKYILYSHDDMYFCPHWDEILLKEINKIDHDNFYFSGTMIQKSNGHIDLDCGNSPEDFDENKFLNNYKNYNLYNHQGSHFAPHIVTKKIWNTVKGFSEEFNPGIASDPDFSMKLWMHGIRVFKGINDFKVYHFSSVTTRKKKNFTQNKGEITFLKKWGFSTKFFKKYYLRTKAKYYGPLKEPNKNLSYYFDLLICKLKLFFI